MCIYIYICAGGLDAGKEKRACKYCGCLFQRRTNKSRYHVQVVVAGVVVAKAPFWIDIVTVFGLLATDLGPGCYDHFNYDHLDVVPKKAQQFAGSLAVRFNVEIRVRNSLQALLFISTSK